MFNVPCKLRYLQLRVITVGCYKRLSVKRTLKCTLHELKKIQQKHLTSRIYCHNGFDIPRSVSYDWPSNHGNYHEKNNALIWFEPTRGNTGWLRIYVYIYRCVCLFVYVFIFYANKQIGYMINFDQALSILLPNPVEHHHYICYLLQPCIFLTW